jgi:hypothetical protein
MLSKKKKEFVPEPPGYGPEEFGYELPSMKREQVDSRIEEPPMDYPQEPESSFKDVFRHNPEKPIFIKVDNFKEIVETVLNVEKKLDELEEIIEKLQEIKQEEEEKIVNWQNEIQNMKDQLKVLEKNFSDKL